MIIDSDVLIFSFRGNANAIHILDTTQNKEISIITYMELLQGMKNKNELNKFIKYLDKYQYTILDLNAEIGRMALNLVTTYGLSHNMQMFDALIASTATFYNKPLLSANAKHYAFIENLQLVKFIV